MRTPTKVALLAGHRYGAHLAEAICSNLLDINFVHAFILHPRNVVTYRGYESPISILNTHNIPITYFDKTTELNCDLIKKNIKPHFTIICGLRQLIPSELLWSLSSTSKKNGTPYSPRGGVICFHPSDLPAGKGLSPVQWTIFENETTGTVSSFFIDLGEIDGGPIIAKKKYSIEPNDDAGALDSKIGETIQVLYEMLRKDITNRTITYTPQPRIAPRNILRPQFKPHDSWIDLCHSTVEEASLHVRAFAKPYGCLLYTSPSPRD